MSGEAPLLSVVIPAYNEGHKIYADLETAFGYLAQAGYPYELIIVDDGSADNTSAEVERFQRERSSEVTLLAYTPNRGKGHAVKVGVMESRGRFILSTDTGGCARYEDTLTGLQILREEGYDIACGSRKLAGSEKHLQHAWHRRIGSAAFHALVRLVLGVRVRDTQCGFKLFTREAARALFQAQRIEGVLYDVEMLVAARRHGYRVKEFPITWSHDLDTRFKPFRGVLIVLRDLWRIKRQTLRWAR